MTSYLPSLIQAALNRGGASIYVGKKDKPNGLGGDLDATKGGDGYVGTILKTIGVGAALALIAAGIVRGGGSVVQASDIIDEVGTGLTIGQRSLFARRPPSIPLSDGFVSPATPVFNRPPTVW